MTIEARWIGAPALREIQLSRVVCADVPETALRDRVELAGVLIDRVSITTAADRIRGFVRSGGTHQIVTVNLDFLTRAHQSPDFRETLNAADLAVADGMPLVWAAGLRGQALPERVAGVELVDECCRIAAEMKESVYLLGAGPGVALLAARRLQERFPGLHVAGVDSPPFGPIEQEQTAQIVQRIRRARPAFLFVAFGAPRQDLWIREHLRELDVRVAMGVGCVFDLLAGHVTRAPAWMRHTGLEWAFRLGQEPGRLWRRYAEDLPMLARLTAESFVPGQRPAELASRSASGNAA